MRRSPQSASRLPRRALRWAVSLALLVFAGPGLSVRAQTSASALVADQAPSATLPAAPFAAAAPSMAFNPAAGLSFGSQRSLTVNAAQPGSFGLNPFGAPAARQTAHAPLFPIGNGLARGATIGPGGPFAASPAPLPSLNQLMRGSTSLHLNSSATGFRLTYRDTLRPGASFTDLARPSTGIVFTSSDLGNGVFLSAGTGSGSHSMAGAPAATLGNGTTGESKHSGTSVNLKLSF